jgi:hypothetical protein
MNAIGMLKYAKTPPKKVDWIYCVGPSTMDIIRIVIPMIVILEKGYVNSLLKLVIYLGYNGSVQMDALGTSEHATMLPWMVICMCYNEPAALDATGTNWHAWLLQWMVVLGMIIWQYIEMIYKKWTLIKQNIFILLQSSQYHELVLMKTEVSVKPNY